MNPLVQQALGIIDQGITEHRPVKVFALFSGGNDSLVNTHIVAQHPNFSGVLHFDTGTGIKATRGYVREVCAQFGWPLWVYKTPVRYADLVRRWGFPGPAGHQLMYRRLKDRCVYMATKEHKAKRSERVMLCTGLRQSESQRRMGYTNPVQRYRAQVWANPIFYWHKADLDAYRADHNLPVNPTSAALGMSGECLCGAFAKPGELARIEAVSPVNARYIRLLQTEAHRCGHHWDWEEAPPRKKKDARREIAGAVDFQPLCASCNVRHELAQEAAK